MGPELESESTVLASELESDSGVINFLKPESESQMESHKKYFASLVEANKHKL